jgi:phage gp36-like protein
MANTILADNLTSRNLKERTYLAADVAAGATTLTVDNATQFVSGDFIYLAPFGDQACEKVTVSITPTGASTLTLTSAIKFAHRRGEEVTSVYGDQIQFMYALNVDGTAPAASDFQVLATVNLDTNEPVTVYTDTNALAELDPSSRWYAYVYKNSVSAGTTDVNEIIPARGDDYGHYCTIEDIRTETGLARNKNIPDTVFDDVRNDVESEINATLVTSYSLPLSSPVPYLVRRIAKLLAAGYILTNQYGVFSQGTTSAKEGEAKLKKGQDLLAKIDDHEYTLVDSTGTSLINQSQISGWPNSSTATYNDDNPETTDPIGGDRVFRISKNF